jgi:Ni2+-binding GTPase involved in maturation of urease and hydrogenase
MRKVIILGSRGSGKHTLQSKITPLLTDFQFSVYESEFTTPFDAAILVVNLADGPMPETRDHLIMAKKAGIPNIFCFLNKSDIITDKSLIDLVQAECEELAKKFGYSKANFFVEIGSATKDRGIKELARLIQANINTSYKGFGFKLPEYRCRRCGYTDNSPFDVCKVCKEKQKTSFLGKLFGKST